MLGGSAFSRVICEVTLVIYLESEVQIGLPLFNVMKLRGSLYNLQIQQSPVLFSKNHNPSILFSLLSASFGRLLCHAMIVMLFV